MNRQSYLKTLIITSVLVVMSGQPVMAQPEIPPILPVDVNRGAGLVVSDPTDLASNPYVRIPVIDAYYQDTRVWFIHTEASDRNMAQRLTKMVEYATLYSPELGKIDPERAGAIYVFTNGVSRKEVAPWGGGPFNFQIDVLDSVPGDSDYTPLRNPRMVSWNDDATPRILKSEAAILEAERAGELTVKRTDVIVNAPIVHPHPAP